MPDYDAAHFDPPAPVALVSLRNPETGAVSLGVPMLLDSGADVTMIPRAALDRLGVVPMEGRAYELTAFDGGSSYAAVVRIELVFCRRVFRGQFLIIDQDWGILGRNILNGVFLSFDGPRLRWDESSRVSETAKGA